MSLRLIFCKIRVGGLKKNLLFNSFPYDCYFKWRWYLILKEICLTLSEFFLEFFRIHPFPNMSSIHISNTNLHSFSFLSFAFFLFLFLFSCSDECQMPEHFWMVKLLGLKLKGVLLSWDSCRSYAIYISFGWIDCRCWNVCD